MLIDRANWPSHRPWLIGIVIATLAAMAWFLFEAYGRADWPGGSSVPGFTFGVIGGAIIIFEFLLWLRRKVRVWHVGAAQTWLRAHIWLGLLCVPLLILHSGLRFGGTLTTAVMALFILVVASGIWGLLLQNVLPRLMIEAAPVDTAFAPMESLVDDLATIGDQVVTATSGVKAEAAVIHSAATIVAVGKMPRVHLPAAAIPEAEGLAVFYREHVAPFLRGANVSASPLASASSAASAFRALKAQLPPAAHEAVDVLESLCQQRRRWNGEARVHFWLHNWLWVHYPLSVALLVLMAAHIVVALKYW